MEQSNGKENYQLLTFMLNDEVFAVEIGKIREVLEFQGVTKVPRLPGYMKGIINLRGSVVPVVDLKQKFGIGATEKKVGTCIIIAEVVVDNNQVVLGALADAVQEVFDLSSEAVEPPPRIGNKLDTAFIKGMGKRDEEFIIVLDLDKVFTADDIIAAKSAAA